MTASVGELLSAEDQAAMAILRACGYQVPDIQSLAMDQQSFAKRIPARFRTIASGIGFQAQTMDLGDGCFTNAYTLRLDLNRVRTEVVSTADGFHLRDILRADAALAAVSGSFSFISDDPTYQPAEPCLDFSCRGGEVVSLPTVTKPAFLVYLGKPMIGTLDATGTLDILGRTYRWIGSKVPRPEAPQPRIFIVFGAANCRVHYTDHPRTGFMRHVDQTTNITPPDPSIIDYVVSWEPRNDHRVTSIHPGGGAGLFAGNFVLRAERRWAENLQEGTPVRITRIAGLDVRHLDGGISIGPSVADAVTGLTSAYDQCLGTSPFRDTRIARTLIGLHGRELWFQVLDGAPLTDTFRGVSPTETAELCTAQGQGPRNVYHLDGGQSSKIAFIEEDKTHVVGSMHYLRWPRSHGEPFRWQGLDGRVLHSGFIVTDSRPERAR